MSSTKYARIINPKNGLSLVIVRSAKKYWDIIPSDSFFERHGNILSERPKAQESGLYTNLSHHGDSQDSEIDQQYEERVAIYNALSNLQNRMKEYQTLRKELQESIAKDQKASKNPVSRTRFKLFSKTNSMTIIHTLTNLSLFLIISSVMAMIALMLLK